MPGVTLTLTGDAGGTTLSDGSGNYTFSSCLWRELYRDAEQGGLGSGLQASTPWTWLPSNGITSISHLSRQDVS